MKNVKIVGFVSKFHYHDFIDACEERNILLAGVYGNGTFEGAYEGTVEDLTSATSAVGVFIG